MNQKILIIVGIVFALVFVLIMAIMMNTITNEANNANDQLNNELINAINNRNIVNTDIGVDIIVETKKHPDVTYSNADKNGEEQAVYLSDETYSKLDATNDDYINPDASFKIDAHTHTNNGITTAIIATQQ